MLEKQKLRLKTKLLIVSCCWIVVHFDCCNCSSSISASIFNTTSNSRRRACPVQYTPEQGLPLLFGGVFSQCTSGCQPRWDEWSEKEAANCNPHKSTIKRTCQPDQVDVIIRAARIHGGLDVMQFSPCQLHSFLGGRTLWMVGDSFMSHQYYSMRCFMLDFWDHSLGECAVSPDPEVQREVWSAADTFHTSVLKGNSPRTTMPRCIHLLQGGRICFVHSVRGEEFAAKPLQAEAPALLEVLQSKVAKSHDIFYINFGRWHFHNCVGLLTESYTRSLVQLGELYHNTRDRFPNVFFKVSSHDHTSCDASGQEAPNMECVPAGKGGYAMSIGRTVANIAERTLGRYGMPVVNIYNLTVGLHQMHSSTDCNHWCMPGMHELDIWTMYKAFQQHRVPRMPLSSTAGTSVRQRCVPVTSDNPPAEWRALL